MESWLSIKLTNDLDLTSFLRSFGNAYCTALRPWISRATWLGLPFMFGRGVIRRMCGVPLPCGGLRRTESLCFSWRQTVCAPNPPYSFTPHLDKPPSKH
jgi:hypothetical protein